IPNDHALRSSDPGHVRVRGPELLARLHLEHPLWRNPEPGAIDDLAHLPHEVGMALDERLETKEERRDQERLHEEDEEEYGLGCEPEPQPRPRRACTKDRVEDPAEERREDRGDRLPFGPVEKPRPPALDRLSIAKRQTMTADADRQVEDPQRHDEERDEEKRLEPARFEDRRREVPERRPDPGEEEQQQDRDAPADAHEKETVPGP